MAFQIGISPDVFWRMTPWQLGCCIEAYQDREEQKHKNNIWLFWHGAAFARAKKLPDLKSLLSFGKKQVKGVDENAILARLRAYNDRLNNGEKT